jgi:hypothetical protein
MHESIDYVLTMQNSILCPSSCVLILNQFMVLNGEKYSSRKHSHLHVDIREGMKWEKHGILTLNEAQEYLVAMTLFIALFILVTR